MHKKTTAVKPFSELSVTKQGLLAATFPKPGRDGLSFMASRNEVDLVNYIYKRDLYYLCLAISKCEWNNSLSRHMTTQLLIHDDMSRTPAYLIVLSIYGQLRHQIIDIHLPAWVELVELFNEFLYLNFSNTKKIEL